MINQTIVRSGDRLAGRSGERDDESRQGRHHSSEWREGEEMGEMTSESDGTSGNSISKTFHRPCESHVS